MNKILKQSKKKIKHLFAADRKKEIKNAQNDMRYQKYIFHVKSECIQKKILDFHQKPHHCCCESQWGGKINCPR